MISQLCCHIRQWEQPPKIQLITAVAISSSKLRFHLEFVWLDAGYSGSVAFMLDECAAAAVCVCVLSERSRLLWRGLQQLFRVLSERREGAKEAEDNPVRAQGRQRK